MNFNIEEIPDLRIAYFRRIGAYGPDNVEIMEKLKSWAKAKKLYDEHAVMLAIPHDDPQIVESQKCRYDACITISENYSLSDLDSISDGRVTGGKYAVFQIEHTAEGMQKAWTEIFPELQNKNVFLDSNRHIIERYQVELVNNHLCEICIPVL